ncbi:MAG: hypothetical protein KAW41_01095 [Candidatus Diapherotrites archaeon]|nr:hypothetical protein [Candidatus Diapherotrites archaeon]
MAVEKPKAAAEPKKYEVPEGPRKGKAPVDHVLANAFMEANARLDLGIKAVHRKALLNVKNPRTAGGVELTGIGYVDVPKVSKNILTQKGGKDVLTQSVEADGLLTASPTLRKRIYAAQRLYPEEVDDIRHKVDAAIMRQHKEASRSEDVLNGEWTDHYIRMDLSESNIIGFVHALHAGGLNYNKGIEAGQQTILFDNINAPGGGLITPEDVLAENEMLREFVNGHVEEGSYKIVSEDRLQQVFDSLMKLAKKKRKGKCADFDALLYIAKLGGKEEFAGKFAGKHGVEKEKVLKVLAGLPDFGATHAFVSLPEKERLGGKIIDAKSQQSETRDKLEEYGMGHLADNISLHLYDLPDYMGVHSRHFEVMLSPKDHSPDEVADAQIQILAQGKRGLGDVKRLEKEAKAAERVVEKQPLVADESFELHQFIRMAEAYPKVLNRARENIDVTALPQYMHELMEAHEFAKDELGVEGMRDPRYRVAVKLANGIVRDILNWANVKIKPPAAPEGLVPKRK